MKSAFFLSKNNNIYCPLCSNLTFILFQALLQPESSETEVKLSEQIERLVHIIMPDLLNYLEMVESGEIVEKQTKKNNVLTQEENDGSKILNKKSRAVKLG